MRSSEHFLYKFANAALSERVDLPGTLQQSVKRAMIGVILPGTELNFFGSVIRGISNTADSNGYRMLLCRSNQSPGDDLQAVKSFLRAKVDGIIASVSEDTLNHGDFAELKKMGTPLVLFHRTKESLDIPSVSMDDFKGAYVATRHLILQGFKRIAHVAASQKVRRFEDRLNGYKSALIDSGFPVDESLIYQGNVSISSGKEAMEYFCRCDKKPDAIFAVEDLVALGVLKAAKELNLLIPDDLGVIGFGNESFDEHLTPALSSVDQQSLTMGKEAFNLLLGLIRSNGSLNDHRSSIVIEPLLQSRESSLIHKPGNGYGHM